MYKSLGVKVDKIHKVLSFNHSAWMAPYIQLNTSYREKATNNFEKNYYKLKNNAVFGRSMMNLRGQRKIKLVRRWEGKGGARHHIANPAFERFKIFSDNLIAVELKKTEIFYNSPLFVGVICLDLSKSLMFNLLYNDIKPYFGDKLTCAYSDTDSFIFLIKDLDPYEFMKNNPHLFDTSDFKPDNPYGIQLLNKKKIALLKDEAGGKQIAEYVGLRSKLYTYRLDDESGTCTIKAKGLTKSVIRKLEFEDYKDCLFQGTDYSPVYKKQRLFRSENHQLFTVEENKLTLSSKDDKRVICEDGISTLPFGYEE